MKDFDNNPENHSTPAHPTRPQTADDANLSNGNAIGTEPTTPTAVPSDHAPFFATEEAFLDHVAQEMATWRGFLIKLFPRLFWEVNDFVEEVISKTLRRCLSPKNRSFYRHFNPALAAFSTWFCWRLKGVALDVWKAHCKRKTTWEARHDAHVRILDDVPGADQDEEDAGGGTPPYVVALTPSLWTRIGRRQYGTTYRSASITQSKHKGGYVWAGHSTSCLDFQHDCDILTLRLSPAEARVFQAMRTGVVEYQDIASETGYTANYVGVLAYRIRQKCAHLDLVDWQASYDGLPYVAVPTKTQMIVFANWQSKIGKTLGMHSAPQPTDPTDKRVPSPQKQGQESTTIRPVRHLDVSTYQTTPQAWMTEAQLNAWHRDVLTSTFAPICTLSDQPAHDDVSAMQPRGTYYVQGYKIPVKIIKKNLGKSPNWYKCKTLSLDAFLLQSDKKFTGQTVRKVLISPYNNNESHHQRETGEKKTSIRVKLKKFPGQMHTVDALQPLTETLRLLTIPGFAARWQCYHDDERQDDFYKFDPDKQRPHKGKPHYQVGSPDLAADPVSSAIGPLVIFPYANVCGQRH